MRPRNLPANPRAFLVAPASTFDRTLFDRARDHLQGLGVTVLERPDLFDSHRHLAGSASRRVDELHEAFRSEAELVWAVRGGAGSMQLLEHLDWELLRERPKLLVGVSDLTAVLNAIVVRCGWPVLHGPVAHRLPDFPDAESQERLWTILRSAGPAPALRGGSPLVGGRAEGLSVGGNLSLVAALQGTPWAIPTRGNVLFLEEVGEPLYRIERMLDSLELAGAFSELSALVLGEWVDCAAGDGEQLHSLFEERLAGLGCPVVFGMPFGHGPRNHAFPLGVRCAVDAEEGVVEFLEPHARAEEA